MSTNKKKILVCIDWYEPGFKAGGPIRSVANLVKALKEDFDFYILTSAFDLGEEQAYENIVLNQWTDHEGVYVKYLDKKALKPDSIKTNIIELNPDILYLNSLFSKLFTIVPLRLANKKKIKLVLAPRGMLGEGALKIKKTKKKLFLSFAKYSGLYKNVIWHASTAYEEKEIKQVFGSSANVIIAQNISTSQNFLFEEIIHKKNKTNKIQFVFISRISTKKNLDLAIESFQKITTLKEINFDIYGIIEDEMYFNNCFSKKFNKNIKISYKGVINPNMINQTLQQSSFMLLPTQHENYGHSIVEAWANGCPVIISQNTPWRNLEEKKLGWDVDITNPDNLTKTIQYCIDMDHNEYMNFVEASYTFFKENIMDQKIIETNKKMFDI